MTSADLLWACREAASRLELVGADVVEVSAPGSSSSPVGGARSARARGRAAPWRRVDLPQRPSPRPGGFSCRWRRAPPTARPSHRRAARATSAPRRRDPRSDRLRLRRRCFGSPRGRLLELSGLEDAQLSWADPAEGGDAVPNPVLVGDERKPPPGVACLNPTEPRPSRPPRGRPGRDRGSRPAARSGSSASRRARGRRRSAPSALVVLLAAELAPQPEPEHALRQAAIASTIAAL